MSIAIVYDNNVCDSRLKPGWGFACWVDFGDHAILFDTGGNGSLLLGNMNRLGLDLHRIGAVILSHTHGDHTGGLGSLLAIQSELTIYGHPALSLRLKGQVRATGARLLEVSKPAEVVPGVYVTGALGDSIVEQALIAKSSQGLVVIIGCGHPGVVSLVKRAREVGDDEIHLVLGGFHLGGRSKVVIRRIIADFRYLGVRKVAPCHCSGDRARAMFAEEYGDDCVLCGVGGKIAIK